MQGCPYFIPLPAVGKPGKGASRETAGECRSHRLLSSRERKTERTHGSRAEVENKRMEKNREVDRTAGKEGNPADRGREGQSDRKKQKKDPCRKCSRWLTVICLLVLLILLCLLFKSCGGESAPAVEVDRLYETDIAPVPSEIIPSAENRRVNLIISEKYRITDDKPFLYVRFPEENIFDVVFTLKDADGETLYRTDYVAPGTTAGIDGTAFLEKGSWKLDCVVSVYDRESGSLLSDCTTVVFDVDYQ